MKGRTAIAKPGGTLQRTSFFANVGVKIPMSGEIADLGGEF